MTPASQLESYLGLKTPAIGVTFLASAPANVARINAPGPSSCTYWKRAAEGQTSYTEAADQLNCPIGAYTHGVDLPPAQQQELQGVVGTMGSLNYIRREEVPKIPKRESKLGVAVYAPLAKATP